MGAFKPYYRGIGAMLNNEKLLGPTFLSMGEKVADEARATAPYDPRHKQHYRDSFHVRLTKDHGRKGERLAAQVYSDDPEGLHIETGTSKTPAHNTLSNALDVLGK